MNGPECHQSVTLALIDVGTIGIVCRDHIGSDSKLSIIVKYVLAAQCVWGGRLNFRAQQ